MELSGRLQELQNEVNFMNDSKDFMDAESICSGNPHVTSPPGLFPILHLKGCWGFRSLRSDKMRSRLIFGIHPVHQETFLHIHKLLRQLRILRNWIPLGRKLPRTNPHVYCKEKWKTRARLRSGMPVRTVSQKFSHLQWRRLFKELLGQTNNDCRFRIFILTNSLHQLRLLAGR